ncbi:MAG: type II toxin-antitoxin system VapC family toxin [Acidobacteria bacterium]|nr:type II toxin-antitoxin system VapC family toxin [Acidobacteriota bacterium]
MMALFVDTAGWMACADASDAAHESCRAARDKALRAGRTLVTTDYVVDETLTLIRLRLSIAAAETWWRQVDGSQRVRWERIDLGRFDRALALFFLHRDKRYSFTDCASFAVMQELKLTGVLTTDKHFKQMGFEVVPGARASAKR